MTYRWQYQQLAEPVFVSEPDLVRAQAHTFVARFSFPNVAAGTKFKMEVRQRTGSPELLTVQRQSVMKIAFHPRSVYLDTDTTLFATADTFGDGFSLGTRDTDRSGIDFVRCRFFSAFPNDTFDHGFWEFNVSAFDGIVYRDVVMRLHVHDDPPVPGGGITMRLARMIPVWDIVGGETTLRSYAKGTQGVGNRQEWDTLGGRTDDVDYDLATSLQWDGGAGAAVNTQVQTPDLTALVNGAIVNNNGILQLGMLAKGTVANFNAEYHSLELIGGEGHPANFRPHLFFRAF